MEKSPRHSASGVFQMFFEPFAQAGNVVVGERIEIDHLRIAAVFNEVTRFVEYVGDASAHTGSKIAAGRAEDDHASAGHVFTTVVADAFHDGMYTAVADAESFAGPAADVGFAFDRAVECDVADQNVVFRDEGGVFRRPDDEFCAGEAFTEVVVGIADDAEGDPFRAESAEALSSRAGRMNGDPVFGQAALAVAFGNFVAEHGTDRAVDVANLCMNDDPFAAFQRRFSLPDQVVVKRAGQIIALLFGTAQRGVFVDRRLVENF